MAYIGLKEIRFNIYVDKTIQGGWRYGMRHCYRCKKCGYEAQVLRQATEPFYCAACGELIGIEEELENVTK